jgi:streptogramin lyase
MRSLVSIVALTLVLASAASAGERLSVSLASSRTTAVDARWTAVVIVRRGGAAVRNVRVTVLARRGGELVSVRARHTRRGRYTGRLRFRSAGRWALSVRVGGGTRRLGSVDVEQGPYRVQEPFGIVAEPAGTLLVADGTANRVLRVDPARGRIDAVTDTSLGRPLELARAVDGTIYVIAGGRVHRIDPASGASTPVTGALDGPTSVAAAPSGDVYVAEYAGRIRRIDPGGGVSTVVASGLDRPHGVEVGPDGRLYVADTYNGAVKRVEPGGSLTTLGSGLATPTGVALTADGAVLVSEHAGGAVARVDGSGVRRITTAVSGPSGVAVGPDGAIYVGALQGAVTIGRVDAATGRVTAVTR